CRVEHAAGAESADAAKDGRSGKAVLAEAPEQCHPERLVLPAVGLADEDAHEDLLAVEHSHGQPPKRVRPRAIPANPAARHAIRVIATFPSASRQAPSWT